MRAAMAILRKDLRLELRSLETLPTMVLFCIATFVIFHFALNQASITGQLAAGVLTVTILFAALLGINRLFVAEREQGGFDGFLLASHHDDFLTGLEPFVDAHIGVGDHRRAHRRELERPRRRGGVDRGVRLARDDEVQPAAAAILAQLGDR